MNARRIAALALAVALGACAGLQPGAESVRVTREQADVSDAVLVAKTELGVGLLVSGGLDNMARNWAYRQGADIVLVRPANRTDRGVSVHVVEAFRSVAK